MRHIRTAGAMMAAVSTDPALSVADLVEMARNAPSIEGRDLAREVTCTAPYTWEDPVNPDWYAADTRHSPPATRHSYNVVAYRFWH